MVTLKDFRPDFDIPHNKRVCIAIHVSDLATNKYGDILDFDVFLPKYGVNLQRDFVWTLDQKRELIISVLKDVPIGEFTVIRHEGPGKEVTLQIIDGKQRLSALIEFIKGEFSILVDGVEYKYNDLPKEVSWEISRYSPIGTMYFSYFDEEISDDDKIAIFNHVNFAGTPQDKEHQELLLNLIKNGKA